jgi:hypothetical protein
MGWNGDATGHAWQGRYMAFPLHDDGHLVGVLRHVEREALRTEPMMRAGGRKWSHAGRHAAVHNMLMQACIKTHIPEARGAGITPW